MDAIALVILLLLRLIIPFGLLIALGEALRRREAKYWLDKQVR